jgi:AAA family ATP:ADP antiporter
MADAKTLEAPPATDARSGLERALGVVTEVRAGEGVTAVLLTANVFLLLTAYYVIKPVREGLILAMPSGAAYKSYLSAAIAVALLFVVPLYGRAADRFAKDKLVVGVTLFFASHLLVFYGLSLSPLESRLGVAFFVWVGIFNMMAVSQIWSFAADLYTEEQGKRLFALVGIGASAGSAVGAYVTKVLVETLGTYQLMLLSGGLLAASAGLSHLTARRQAAARAARGVTTPAPAEVAASAASGTATEDGEPESGTFAMVFRHKYLLLIGLFSVLFTLVNTNGEFMLSTLVSDAAKEAARGATDTRAASRAFSTKFYSDFFLWVNVAVLVLQTFAVSRIVKFGGLRIAFFVLPVIALLDASFVLATPMLAVLRPWKIAENATDYSVNNTLRNMLWLPTTREMKYKAKQAVDTFFVRSGDVGSALLVAVLAQGLGLGVRAFAAVNVVLVLAWLVVARGIVRESARLAAGARV